MTKVDYKKAAAALTPITTAIETLPPADRARVVASCCILTDVSLQEVVDIVNEGKR